MKRFYIIPILLMTAVLFAGCSYDDTDLWDKVNDQEERIASLEQWQATVNTNIATLQSLVGALQNNEYITNVSTFTSPAPGGYTITFSQSGEATIWNGAKGDVGETPAAPAFGVAEYPANSGNYYWTLDGSFIEVGGEKMPVTGVKGNTGATGPQGATGEDGEDGADGIIPQLRIDATTNYWEVSYDKGSTWSSLDVKATGADGADDAIFADIDNTNSDYVVFTLADATTIKVSKQAGSGASLVGFDSYDVFYASPGNNAIAITLPPTLQASDIVMLSASIISYSGVATDVQTRAGSDEGWQVAVSKPTFTGGVLDAGSAKVTLTAAPADIKLSETALLTVTLVDANGKRHSVSRPVKYFDGLIVDATAGSLSTVVPDASTTRLAIRGGIDGDDFTYIKETLTALEVLDISMTDLTAIPNMALMQHTAITRVALPPTVTEIGMMAFGYCSKLTTFDSENVETINSAAFMACKALNKVVLRDKLKTIGTGGFSNTGITSIELPGSIESLGESLFYYCYLLESVVLNEGIPSIPAGIFNSCISLERVALPGSITSIGAKAFDYCESLKSISIPAGVTTIGEEAFKGCKKLTTVYSYADPAPAIDQYAFDSVYTAIRTLYYPSGTDYSTWAVHFNTTVAQ